MLFYTVEKQYIRTLDIDKIVKRFALTRYIFKNLVTVSSTNGDSIRWYQETAADLTVTAPTVVADIAPLAVFTTLAIVELIGKVREYRNVIGQLHSDLVVAEKQKDILDEAAGRRHQNRMDRIKEEREEMWPTVAKIDTSEWRDPRADL